MTNKIMKKIIKESFTPESFISQSSHDFGYDRFMDGGCGVLSISLDDIWGNSTQSNCVIITRRLDDNDDVFINRWKTNEYQEDYGQKNNNEADNDDDDLSYLYRLSNFGAIDHVVWNNPNDKNSYYDISGKHNSVEELLEYMEDNNPSAEFGFKILDIQELKSIEEKSELEDIISKGLKEKELNSDSLILNFINSDKRLIEINKILNNYFNNESKDINNKIEILYFTSKNLDKLSVPKDIIKNFLQQENSHIKLEFEKEVVDLIIKHSMLPSTKDGNNLKSLYENLSHFEDLFPENYNKHEFLNMGLSAYYKSSIFSHEKICSFYMENFKDPQQISNFVANVEAYKILSIHSEIDKSYKNITNDDKYDVLGSMLEENKYDSLSFIFSEDVQDIKYLPAIKNINFNDENLNNDKFKYAILNLSIFNKMDKFIEDKNNDLFFDNKQHIDKIILQSFSDHRAEKLENKNKTKNKNRMSI